MTISDYANCPEWQLPYTGKTKIVLAIPPRMMTSRAFVEELGIPNRPITTSCPITGRERTRPLRAHYTTRIASIAVMLWKKRGDYERVHLRLGNRPYFHYVPLYPTRILADALARVAKKDERTRAIKHRALKSRSR